MIADRDRLLRMLIGRQRPAEIVPPPARSAASGSGVLTDPQKNHLRRFYDGITRELDASAFGTVSFFLNLGYKPTAAPQRSAMQLPDRVINLNSVKLVCETIGDCDLTGADVIGVGCGRGGTEWLLARHYGVRSVTGMDLSHAATAFCRRAHGPVGGRFVNGDAEYLPFASACCDAVTSIESACDYPNRVGFYSEVCRILRPGGVFLYADVFMQGVTPAVCLDFFGGIGATIERHDDVTHNVMASCTEVSDRRLRAFAETGQEQTMHNFMNAPGSELFRAMEEGTATFDIFQIRTREKVSTDE